MRRIPVLTPILFVTEFLLLPVLSLTVSTALAQESSQNPRVKSLKGIYAVHVVIEDFDDNEKA